MFLTPTPLYSCSIKPQATVYHCLSPKGQRAGTALMERYDYASRSACLRNRIAISYHQNSMHESLPTGCFFGLCLSPQITKPTWQFVQFELLLPVGQWVFDKSRVRLNLKQPSPQDYSCNLLYSCSFKSQAAEPS